MAFHAFKTRNAGAHLGHGSVAFVGGALIGYGLCKLVHGKAAAVACRALGRKNVVRTGTLVAVSDCGFLAEEEGTVVFQAAQPPVEITRLNLQMLGRIAVTFGRHFFTISAQTTSP